MNFKLTFNRPAVRQFIEGGEGRGLKIKIENGTVMFSPSPTPDGEDVASLAPRTRGGYESIVEGTSANEVLKHLKNPAGPFFTLRRVGKDWVAAEPYKGKDAPPKFEPHVRVWHSSQPKQSVKATAAPKRAATPKTQVTHTPEPVDIAERVRWAYAKLGEDRRPGRPSREIAEARQIKESFEAMAMEFISNPNGSSIDVKAAVDAYNQLGAFLRTVAPEAIRNAEPKPMAPVPMAPAPRRGPKAKNFVTPPTAKAAKVTPSHDDEEAEAQRKEAMKKLGLEERAVPVSKRSRSVNTRAFGGERLIA